MFWMWFAAFFSMMTKSSENVLGIYYRRKNKDIEPMLSDDPEPQAEMAEALKSE